MAQVTETPVVGAVTTSTAKVAVRTDAAAGVVVEYATNRYFTNSSQTTSVQTASADDFTTIIDLTNLSANTRYWYRIKVDGVVQNLGVVTRFNTFPASGDFVFAVFADVAPIDGSALAYGSAADDAPLFAMQIGDLDHRDPTTLSAMRQMHRDMRDKTLEHGEDFVNRILSKRALVHIWDDHDYGGNDEDKDFAGRSNAWQAFKEYWPTYPLANGSNGLWHSFTCCDAEFFVLDLRSQRDPGTDTDNSDKSMLDGDNLSTGDQKTWLKNGLKNSTKKWKFVISSVSFNEDARPASTDIWHSYSTEAQELKTWLANEGIDDVIVISGDLHTGGGIDDGTNSLVGLPEITCPHTNLAKGNARNLGTWSVGVTAGKPGGRGYCLVSVTSTSVTLQAYAQNGTLRHGYTIT